MVTPNDRAIEIVRHLLRTLTRTAEERNYDLQQTSYSRWAIREILVLLQRNHDLPPLMVVENFRDKMDGYSCMSSKTSYKFSVAKDMAEWIIDWLIA